MSGYESKAQRTAFASVLLLISKTADEGLAKPSGKISNDAIYFGMNSVPIASLSSLPLRLCNLKETHICVLFLLRINMAIYSTGIPAV